ncbi:MAG: sugar ABC transporter substrate-binding protein [Chloroflexota bacterium]
MLQDNRIGNRFVLTLLVGLLCLLLTACGGAADAPAASDDEAMADDAMASDSGLSLEGKTVGVAVVGTDHNFDRQAFQGVLDKIEELGGEAIQANAERNDQKQVSDLENLMAQEPDAIVNILGNGDVLDPIFEKIREAGIPLFTVDAPSVHSLNNTMSDNYEIGSTLARQLAEDIGGEGNIAVFNGFMGIRVCGIRYEQLVQVLKDYPNISIIQPELQDVIPNTIEDAKNKIQDLLQQYPEGELGAIWSCWDIPSIGATQALEEAGRTEVKVYGIDGDPTALEIMSDPASPLTADMAQQPYVIGQTSAENVAKYLAGGEVPTTSFVQPFLVTKENVDTMMPILLGSPEEREAALAAVDGGAGSVSTDGLSLDGKTVGVAVVGTDHGFDRQALQGVTDMIEQLGGEAIVANAERNDQKQVSDLENLMAQEPDAIVNILGNGDVLDPVFEKIGEAGIPLLTVDAPSIHSINNTMSDNYLIGSTLARQLAEDIGGEGNIAVFNGFMGIRVCGIRYEQLVQVLKDYPNISIIQPELQDVIPNTIEDAKNKIQDLLQQYPEGELKAVWSCWDIPSIGVTQALEEAGRNEVKVYGIDGDATALEIMSDPESSMTADMAQQPYLIGQTSGANVARYLAGNFVPLTSYVQPFLVTKENVDEMRKVLGQIE